MIRCWKFPNYNTSVKCGVTAVTLHYKCKLNLYKIIMIIIIIIIKIKLLVVDIKFIIVSTISRKCK